MPSRSTKRKMAKSPIDRYKNFTKVEPCPYKWLTKEDLKSDSVKQQVTPTTLTLDKRETDSPWTQRPCSRLRSRTVLEQVFCKNCKKLVGKVDSMVHLLRKCNRAEEKEEVTLDHPAKSLQQPIPCIYNDCNTRFSYRHSLYAHVRSVHEKVRRQCENCGKSQSYVHFWAHTKKCIRKGKLKYFCTFEKCSMGFITKEDKDCHEEKHTFLAKCPMKNCSKYLSPKNLRQHLRTVHQKVQKQCEYCQKLVSYRNYGHFKRCAEKH